MAKWEYRIESAIIYGEPRLPNETPHLTTELLNELGEDEWELIRITRNTSNQVGNLVFKRPIE